MDSSKLKPGETVEPCHADPTLRVRNPITTLGDSDLVLSSGYTSRGYVSHFLPDREVNLAKLNKALADVFGEPALRMMDMRLEIDREYWMQLCGNPWSGNIYQYNFKSPIFERSEVQVLQETISTLQAENAALKATKR